MPDSLMVQAKKNQEAEKELPTVAWTMKKIENALHLPEEDARRFKGTGVDQKYYVAKYVMQETTPEKIAAKITEINAVEELLQQRSSTGRVSPADYARAISTVCNTDRDAKSFVANPKDEADKILRILERVFENIYEHEGFRMPISFKSISDLKKALAEANEFETKRAKGYAQPAADIIELSPAIWRSIEKFMANGSDERMYVDILSGKTAFMNDGNLSPKSFTIKDGQTFFIDKNHDDYGFFLVGW